VTNVQTCDDGELSENLNMDERIARDDRELMRDSHTITKYFNDIVTNTMFLIKHCPKARIWRANPFRHTGRVPIAETYDDLYRLA